jgi:GNAT superfamily N-acetyltransferase
LADNPEDDFVEVPATESKVRLGDAAYTGAALSTMFAPGAGVADVMGYAPDPFNPGQMSPSFSENVKQGNYLDAGIQTLGVAGDAMYAIAPFTAGMTALPGAALKSVQAFAKGVKGGEALIETMPNRLLFPDLKFSDVTLRESNIEPGAVDIELLRAGEKGKGLGSETLKRVTDRADETGTTLTLHPSPYGDGGLEEAELIEFYKRNGFEFKYPDPDNPDPILDMVREPRPTAPKSTGLLGGDKPQRFYHGTGAAYKEFDPDAPYTFVADSPATSDFYAIDGDSPNTRPVYLKDVNFFDVDNSDHLNQLLESDWYAQYGKSLERNFGENDRTFLDLVEAGDYGAIEDSGLPDWIRSQGFDGFTTYEQAGKNYAVFDVNNIVPGVAKKAEGGVITLADTARNMFRGPRGVGSLAPKARNMFRPMVS